MKSEFYFLAKVALVLSVVDAFVPGAETFAKNKGKGYHDHDVPHRPDNDGKQRFYPNKPHHYPQPKDNPQPQRYPYTKEIHLGLFDLNPFHGSGSGGSKEVLDEQWEIQQAILRERRGHNDDRAHAKKFVAPVSKTIEIVGKQKNGDNKVKTAHDDVSTEHEHKKSLAEIFFGVKKF
ncbi:hypothetical protein HJC23_011097 [Cyclotella cryptica]|uniref:Uncharacterized protein n=1 Tax=Cyclotella cryptica TaxID=29204 RepID=A0ABD3P797_9STRA|eukprot:CCRYP_017293-RA/>CCRYP_017293-RA protein AED:0.16 eAED:0.16 QI:0/-1/0/1/-1/1/1/0/176